ncbi:hypothetical protein [Herbaspirillum sp. RV1423]|uniref:hypothetical protein n=1 Tax=Herbaspirillum sp. RV1423 TaxID=1443993 RepID=UPI0004BC326B|nr:hypothetical protein [Herbaspirillum sp. RV1423]
MHGMFIQPANAVMQFLFLIWPILLLPVLVAWLTRPDAPSTPPAPRPQRRPGTAAPTATQRAQIPSTAARQRADRAYKEMQQLAADERRRESPAYRRAAQSAYEEMLALAAEDEA